MLFYLFGHEKTRRNKQLKKTMGKFREIKDLMDWLHLRADEANPPTNENSPIGPFFLLLIIFLF